MTDHLSRLKSSTLDLVTADFVDEEDATHYGIKGMKWGVRKDRRTAGEGGKKGGSSSGDTKKPETSTSSTGTGSGKAPAPENQIQNRVESSADRYSRLKGDSKNANNWTEQDLKFFNARTEALGKVDKLNQEKPNWLQEAAKDVLQQTAKRQMQTIVDGMANKYISGPLLENLKNQDKK